MEEKVIDFASSIRLAGGNASLAHELLGMLLEQIDEDREKIFQAYNERDYDEMLRLVHKLHGAVAYCGVPRLRRAVTAMEIALKEEKDYQFPTLVKSLNFEIDTLINLDKEKILHD
jgi:two-component system sensor histidine kinase BarA